MRHLAARRTSPAYACGTVSIEHLLNTPTELAAAGSELWLLIVEWATKEAPLHVKAELQVGVAAVRLLVLL